MNALDVGHLQSLLGYGSLASVIVITLAIGIRAVVDLYAARGADRRFTQAQSRAFDTQGAAAADAKARSSSGQTEDVNLVIPSKKPCTVLALASLFDLYSKQIDKYQAQTQSRATLSFLCAVVSMVAGIVLLVSSGWAIVHLAISDYGDKSHIDTHLLSGSIISVIGGAMSVFITKTFLDIHRTSLLQLNHYFKQPVLSSHILSAQRLIDLLIRDKLRETMYEELIRQVIGLIAAEQAQSVDLTGKIKLEKQVNTSRLALPRVKQQKKFKDGNKPEGSSTR